MHKSSILALYPSQLKIKVPIIHDKITFWMYLGVNEILPEKQPYTSIVLGTGVIWDMKHVYHMKNGRFVTNCCHK